MMRLRNFRKNDEGLVLILGAIMLIGFVIMGIMAFFFVDMLVKNILPIGIAIVLVICLPILAKGFFFKQTGQMYPTGGGKKTTTGGKKK